MTLHTNARPGGPPVTRADGAGLWARATVAQQQLAELERSVLAAQERYAELRARLEAKGLQLPPSSPRSS
jgi:hypothetical protein